MRSSIMNISQSYALKMSLDLVDILLLDYMTTFFGSGFAVPFVVQDGNKKTTFYWLSIKKVLEDLPVLHIKRRMLSQRLQKLEQKEIISRLQVKNKTYYNLINPMDFL